jgi:uncharacterized iron-regulated protein
MTLHRLLPLSVVCSAVLAGCASWGPSPERIVETATGRTLTCAELADAVRAAPLALLGEQHDEQAHHQRRGALIERLRGSGAVVVAEHLPRGEGVPLQGRPLLAALQSGGFKPEAWDWPLHQPLFEGVAAAGVPLRGGDLDDPTLKAVLKSDAGVPAPLRALLDAAPLSAPAQAALDADLQESHGGAIPPARLDTMRRAQRARDASLLAALQASGGRPAVLVAGNGHARGDYGVPQLWHPAGLVNVALVSPGQAVPGTYTHVWTVDPQVPVKACER